MRITLDQLATLRASQQFFVAEMYTFALPSGSVARFVDTDIPVRYGGVTFLANSLIISGLRLKLSVGVEVDEQNLKIAAHPSYNLAGAAFLAGISDGLLDGATLARDRGFWLQPEDALTSEPIVAARMFYGFVSTITKAGRSAVELKVKSPLALLDLDTPRNYWIPTCLWTLFDAGCKLSKTAFSTNVVIDADPTPTTLPIVGGIANPTGADGFSTYALGRILFTTGINRGLSISLKDNDSLNLYPAVPLKVPPQRGDTATITVGCSKQQQTCDDKFDNLPNFRAFPKVPPVTTSL